MGITFNGADAYAMVLVLKCGCLVDHYMSPVAPTGILLLVNPRPTVQDHARAVTVLYPAVSPPAIRLLPE